MGLRAQAVAGHWGRGAPRPRVQTITLAPAFPIPMSDFATTAASTWKRLSATAVRLFHGYANWLVGITWKRFLVLSVLLLILAGMLQNLPPFRWSWSEVLEDAPVVPSPRTPALPAVPKGSTAKSVASTRDVNDDDVVISIGKDGVRISPRRAAVEAPAPAASAAPPASAATGSAAASPAFASATPAASQAGAGEGSRIEIDAPAGAALRAAVQAARAAADAATQEARREADAARRDADEAHRDAQAAIDEARREGAEAARSSHQTRRTRVVQAGDLPELAFFFIVASAMLKGTYKGRVQAEVKAAAAAETAESEQLKRQVVEARMAAMQAQVEPHFLFNTLASIDHLIETDPKRASQMQKNLIALLRASMPTMREAHPAAHNLGREMAVIRPYLEILKVRMEDRLRTELDVPDGLLSADFPPMMIQSLVENAIKHGLEPKPEGGTLSVRAEILHGKLAVTVADTGLGFGKAATAGTGVGLNNIRERLQLLYGSKASMTVAENSPSGTRVTLTVPYLAQPREGEAA